jgi:hypothetical protein
MFSGNGEGDHVWIGGDLLKSCMLPDQKNGRSEINFPSKNVLKLLLDARIDLDNLTGGIPQWLTILDCETIALNDALAVSM